MRLKRFYFVPFFLEVTKKTRKKSSRHFKSHLCKNDTLKREKGWKCVYGFFPFSLQRSLIKMETSFLALHYFGRNSPLQSHFIVIIIFSLYEKGRERRKFGSFSRLHGRNGTNFRAKASNILEFPLSLFMDFNYHPTHL